MSCLKGKQVIRNGEPLLTERFILLEDVVNLPFGNSRAETDKYSKMNSKPNKKIRRLTVKQSKLGSNFLPHVKTVPGYQ